MVTDIDLEQAELVGLLRAAIEARHQRDTYSRQYDIFAKRFKAYLEKHLDEVLYDGERGIEAALQTRQSHGTYDTAHMPLELIKRLWKANALEIDPAVIKALEGKDTLPIDVKKWEIPGGLSYALMVKEL